MIQGEGSLPFPRDRFSWLIAAILFGVLLLFYYGILYGRLEEGYRGGFNYPIAKNSAPVEVHMASPKYISSMAERDLLVSITNPTTSTMSILIIPKVVLPANSDSTYFVFIGLPNVQGEFRESGALHFTNIPPGATISQEVNLKLIGQEIADDNVLIEFDIILPGEGGGNNVRRALDLQPPVNMKIHSVRTLVQNLIAFVLLPPWANGFLPLVALFAVYLYGLHEAFAQQHYGALMWGWLALLFLTTVTVVSMAGEWAIALLGEAGGDTTRAGILSGVVIFLIFVSILLDSTVCHGKDKAGGKTGDKATGDKAASDKTDDKAASDHTGCGHPHCIVITPPPDTRRLTIDMMGDGTAGVRVDAPQVAAVAIDSPPAAPLAKSKRKPSGGKAKSRRANDDKGAAPLPGPLPQGEGAAPLPNPLPQGEGAAPLPGPLPQGEGAAPLPGPLPRGEGAAPLSGPLPQGEGARPPHPHADYIRRQKFGLRRAAPPVAPPPPAPPADDITQLPPAPQEGPTYQPPPGASAPEAAPAPAAAPDSSMAWLEKDAADDAPHDASDDPPLTPGP